MHLSFLQSGLFESEDRHDSVLTNESAEPEDADDEDDAVLVKELDDGSAGGIHESPDARCCETFFLDF